MTTLIVPDYDAGIAFCVDALGLDLVEDIDMGGGKRWVVVGGRDGGRLLLARAADDAQAASIGKQAGGRVAFFVHTGDFAGTHARLVDAGLKFEDAPRRESYGTVAVFSDPFGNRWDLIEPKDIGQ
ncbi:VOC family protein [Porphyrobacter sp. CACIAM 03H1]|jgi:catechol 2,3-dioxygenase-like lactoylglutathione lyase family enzyme|uniref:VOC family protein n=1 Tax=Porphyrobacter sp. CACIAM 03H1 TaxID=2003315 RepID=UPI000B5A5417|nr:VOC family protein [Porphyrobacter sp. CACIAM 03H1]ASJ89491.1 extradiol dioxygenase [Porphyrobacter sp. CACIAM 03H1]